MKDGRDVVQVVNATVRGEFAAAVEEFRFMNSVPDAEKRRLGGLLSRAVVGKAPEHRVGSADEWMAWCECSRLSVTEAKTEFVDRVFSSRNTLSKLCRADQGEQPAMQHQQLPQRPPLPSGSNDSPSRRDVEALGGERNVAQPRNIQLPAASS